MVSSRTSSKRSNPGFTLIEILIAVMILAFISTMTAISIQKSLKTKSKLEKEIDDYASLRDALNIMTHDLNLAFHWVDINQVVKDKITAEAAAAGKPSPFASPGANIPAGTPYEDLTGFVGTKDSLYFTTLSHERTITNSQESDQAKIGYYVKSVQDLEKNSVKALMRSESTFLDGQDLTRGGGKEVRLLENVKELKFQYMGGTDKEKKWVDSWKTTDRNDDKMFNRFPDAVQIDLTTSKNNREVKLSTVVSIHMPNNDPFKTAGPTSTATPSGR